MDTYVENPQTKTGNSTSDTRNQASSPPPTSSDFDVRHFLILASCMHAGVRILRLTYHPFYHALPDSPARTDLVAAFGWEMSVVGRFDAGHESMVYASDFRSEAVRDEVDAEVKGGAEGGVGVGVGSEVKTGEFTVVSTSFYDRRVCVWGFVDEVKKGLVEGMAMGKGKGRGRLGV